MKSLKKIFVFIIIILCLFSSSAFAINIIAQPSNSTSNSRNNNDLTVTNSSSHSNSVRNNEVSSNISHASPAVSTSDTTTRAKNSGLTVSDVIGIIVISVGIVNILLGIAIIIRFK